MGTGSGASALGHGLSSKGPSGHGGGIPDPSGFQPLSFIEKLEGITMCLESELQSTRVAPDIHEGLSSSNGLVSMSCGSCKAQVFKHGALNRLTCFCGHSMCYACGVNLPGGPYLTALDTYRHFCVHERYDSRKPCKECKLCDLYENERKQKTKTKPAQAHKRKSMPLIQKRRTKSAVPEEPRPMATPEPRRLSQSTVVTRSRENTSPSHPATTRAERWAARQHKVALTSKRSRKAADPEDEDVSEGAEDALNGGGSEFEDGYVSVTPTDVLNGGNSEFKDGYVSVTPTDIDKRKNIDHYFQTPEAGDVVADEGEDQVLEREYRLVILNDIGLSRGECSKEPQMEVISGLATFKEIGPNELNSEKVKDSDPAPPKNSTLELLLTSYAEDTDGEVSLEI